MRWIHSGFAPWQGSRRWGWGSARPLFAAGACVALAASAPGAARASSFAGRLSVGPTYMHNDSKTDIGDSSGPGLAAQLDAGLQLWPPLVVHATLIYDDSRWLHLKNTTAETYEGSMLGLGLGATARFAGISLGGAAGGQFTSFPQNDDAASGPNGASLGSFISLSAGYVWTIAGSLNAGVHAIYRYRRSEDETNSIVYDPIGQHLGLVLSLGLDGEPLHGN